MKYIGKAIELLKKFSSGVRCPSWNEEHIEHTMFHKHFSQKGLNSVEEKDVKKYILEEHNPKTVEIGRKAKSSVDSIKNCMVLAEKIGDVFFAKHGTAILFPITREEAEFLKKEEKKLLRGSQ